MTFDNYSGPPEDPETHAMVEHLVEFETEMFSLERNRELQGYTYSTPIYHEIEKDLFRTNCRNRLKGSTSKQLRRLLMDLHGEDWINAL